MEVRCQLHVLATLTHEKQSPGADCMGTSESPRVCLDAVDRKNLRRLPLREMESTRVVPKLMPPIYFHGNYTRYKEHNNTI